MSDPASLSPGGALPARPPQEVWADAGQLFAVFACDSRYAKQSLPDLWLRILPALSTGQYAIARRPAEVKGTDKMLAAPNAAVLYARVSAETDARLREARALPRLAFAEWMSGPHIWIIEAPGDQPTVGKLLDRLSRETFGTSGFSAVMLGKNGKYRVRDFGK